MKYRSALIIPFALVLTAALCLGLPALTQTGTPANAAPVVITPNPGVVSVVDYRATIVPDGILTGVSRRWDGTEAANTDGSLKAEFISEVEEQADYMASMGLKLWPAILIYQNKAAPYIPAGMEVSFDTGCGFTESAPNYGSATFRAWYTTMVQNILAQWGADDRIGGFHLGLGASGEAMNVSTQNCGSKQTYFEQVVPCDDYVEFVKLALRTWAAGTQKPLRFTTNVRACAPLSWPVNMIPGLTHVRPNSSWNMQYRTRRPLARRQLCHLRLSRLRRCEM